MNETLETNPNQDIPSVQMPAPSMKSNIIKVVLLIGLAVFFAWIFVESGMTFKPIRCGEGCFGFGFILLSVPIFIAETLRPILSIIPKALFSLAESLPLLWPFIIGNIILKYSLIIILTGLPFFGFYFWVRRVSNFDRKNLKRIFVVACLLLIITISVSESLGSDRTIIATAKSMDRICENDSSCKNALYGKVSKNVYIGSENEKVTSGLRMPSISSLRTDKVLKALTSLPDSFREAYCDNIYGAITNISAERSNLNACKEKLALTSNNPPLWDDCLAQTDFYSRRLSSLIDSCTQNFIQINPINIIGLTGFLAPIKYSNQYRQNDNAYDMSGSKMEPRLVVLDGGILALAFSLSDRQPPRSTELSIIQMNPNSFPKYLDGNWSPVLGNSDGERNAKRLSFEQKIIFNNKVGEEHLRMSAYADSDVYRVGFLIQNIFIIVEVRGEVIYDTTTDEIRESAERLAEHIIVFLSPQ